MEVEAQTPSPESQPASSAAPAQTSSTPATTAAAATPEATPASSDVVTPAAWTPDYKFKAAGAEHEIPEMYRSLVKDQKTLEEVKRLHEKAYGLDSLAQSRDALKKEIAQYAPKLKEYETVSQNFAKLSHFVENKDFDSFFQGLGIPEKSIIEWIQHKIDLAQAAPEVRQQYEQNRVLQQQQWDLQQQNAHYKAQAQELEQARAYTQVHNTVGSMAADYAQAYDAKMGEGAFIDAVIQRGLALTHANGGVEPELSAVISMITNELSKLGMAVGGPSLANNLQNTQALQGNTPPSKKPTIPVIPAGGQSPISTPIKSMEDLNKRRASMGIT